MGFLAPWFLAGLAAVALPVYLHLLRRHKSTPQPFSSLMFFERRTQSSIKHRRLKYLLLLAARAAFLVLLALAFANPYLDKAAAPAAEARRMRVFAVDNSFSMRAGDRLEQARQQALSAISGRAPAEEAVVVAFASQSRLLTQPTRQADDLVAAVRSIEPSDSRSSFGELARVLRSLAASSRLPLEVHLFSDMQKTSMPPGFADLQLSPGTRLVMHPVAGSQPPNWTVESVTAPGELYDPKQNRVEAIIAGFHTPAASRSVSLVVNGRVLQTRSVEVPAGGRAAVEFLSLQGPHGFNRCEVRIDSADSLPADDRFLFAVERADPRPVLFLHQARDPRSPLYFRAALDASSRAAFSLVTAEAGKLEGIDPSRFAFVVLSDVPYLPEPFRNALDRFVRDGGSVLLAAGPVSARASRLPVFDEAVLESRHSARSAERFQSVASLDDAHLSVRRAGRWQGVRFYQAVRVEPGSARVLVRLDDQTPLLLEKRIREGRALLFASTFDNLSNDFPLHPSFVPFIEQTSRYLGGLEDRPAGLTVDSHLELRSAGDRAVGVELIGPEEQRPLSLKEAATAQSYQVAREGFYELRKADRRRRMFAANADRRESDLTPIPGETLALWQNTTAETGSTASALEPARTRSAFWWRLLLLALVLAMAESLLAGRYLSHHEKEVA